MITYPHDLAKSHFKLALIGFGPAYLALVFLFFPMFLADSMSGISLFLFLVALTIPVVLATSWFLRGDSKGNKTLWPFFLAWQFFGFELGFVFSSALAGASMAVVDGVVQASNLLQQKAFFAMVMLLPLQFFIIPWVIWSRRLLRRFIPELFDPIASK